MDYPLLNMANHYLGDINQPEKKTMKADKELNFETKSAMNRKN